MSRSLSNELLSELTSQNSSDPFLTLLTFTHDNLSGPIRLVNNTENITSRGNVFSAFPMKVTLPADDGERVPEFNLILSNVSLDLIIELRQITDPLNATMELILASRPDEVQISYEELKLDRISYNAQTISATLFLDSLLYTELGSEAYGPSNFPGIF